MLLVEVGGVIPGGGGAVLRVRPAAATIRICGGSRCQDDVTRGSKCSEGLLAGWQAPDREPVWVTRYYSCL